MNRSEFIDLLNRNHEQIVEINKVKGHDYAGEDDALSNFKESARAVDVSPLVIWFVYFDKHMSAIRTFIREGAVQSEPIEGRIQDAILYLYLLMGLVEEMQNVDLTLDDRIAS